MNTQKTTQNKALKQPNGRSSMHSDYEQSLMDIGLVSDSQKTEPEVYSKSILGFSGRSVINKILDFFSFPI